MDQPTAPDRSADSDFSFLMAVLTAALLALHSLRWAECGIETGFYPLRCGESALTLGSSGFFLTQALKALAQTSPRDTAAYCAARGEVAAAALVLAASLLQFQLIQYRRRTGQLSDDPVTVF